MANFAANLFAVYSIAPSLVVTLGVGIALTLSAVVVLMNRRTQ